MLTEDPPTGPQRLRIAATRAGQHDGDGAGEDAFEYSLEDVVRNGEVPVADLTRGGGGDDDGDEDGGAERVGVAAAPAGPPPTLRRRLRRAPSARAGTVLVPPVVPATPTAPISMPRPGRPGRPFPGQSAARAKVLRQRRRRRRLLIALTMFMAMCTFLVGVAAVYVQTRLGQIKRVIVPTLVEDTPGAVMNVLLVGSDSRAGLDAADAPGFGGSTVAGQRSDTMMLLHIDPNQTKAAIVSVPRDLYVPIADTSYSDRVNTAFAVGGPEQLVATIQHTLGITINHYVQVDFTGFKDIVSTVGGVSIYVPYPVRDSGSGLDIGKAGCFALNGQQALAWVRSRKMEFLINGVWQEDGRADLGRIERQQDFMRRMMKKAISSGATNPIQLNRLIGIGVRDVTFDSALSTKDLTSLARRFSSLDPDRVVLKTLPTDPADIDGKAVLTLQTAQAQPMIDLLNGKGPLDATPTTIAGAGATSTTTPAPSTLSTSTTTATAVKPADVKVRVLNGVGTVGAATKAGTALGGLGFAVTDKTDAPAPAAKTTITYATGQLAKAQLVQSALLSPAVLKEDATLKTADVALLLGSDFGGVRTALAPVAPASTAPTTTTLPAQINPVPLPKGTTAPSC